MTNIFIAEAVPSLNKGEAIILMGLMQSVKDIKDVEISVLSYYPEIDGPRYPGINVVSAPYCLRIPENFPERLNWIRLANSAFVCVKHLLFGLIWRVFGQPIALKVMRSPIWGIYCNADVIIVGHDILLQTPYGDALHFLYIYVALLARILGKRIVVYAGTIGFSCNRQNSSNHPLSKFIKYVWKYFDLITVRDPGSIDNLRSMGVPTNNAFLTADLAFIAPSANRERALEILGQESVKRRTGPLVGLTLTYMITKRAAPELGDNTLARYKSGLYLIAESIETLVDELDATILFLPHCIEPGYRDDRIVARDVVAQMNRSDQVHLIENEYTPEELKAIIGCCDIFLGERTHSAIGAISMGIPTLNLSHLADQRAFSMLSEIIGDNVIFIEQVSSKLLIEKIKQILINRDAVIAEMCKGLNPVMERAYQNGFLLKSLID